MIPNDETIKFVREGSLTRHEEKDLTYRLDNERKRIDGHVDSLTAILQRVWKELQTEKGEYLIYSNRYGLQVKDLIGKNKLYAYTKAVYRIKEMLKKDSKIIRSYDFKMIKEKSKDGDLTISFKIDTIYGSTEIKGVQVL